MSKHLFGIVVTDHGTASNNRGETDGNLTTLQKILWNGDVHTTVSAEAIRWAIRSVWQEQTQNLNRTWDDAQRANTWKDPRFTTDVGSYLDNDVLGYMSAEAARQEVETTSDTGNRGRARGTTTVRRARLEVTRAISLRPWMGDVSFNAASIGATPSASSTGRDPVPYQAEIHATRYQYGFALTPEDLYEPARCLPVLDAILNLREVAGNHGRFLYDFSPDALVLRWTDDFAPRMLYAFEVDEDEQLTADTVLRRAQAGDIDAAELVVGGSLALTQTGELLKASGATVVPGVKSAVQEMQSRIKRDLRLGG